MGQRLVDELDQFLGPVIVLWRDEQPVIVHRLMGHRLDVAVMIQSRRDVQARRDVAAGNAEKLIQQRTLGGIGLVVPVILVITLRILADFGFKKRPFLLASEDHMIENAAL